MTKTTSASRAASAALAASLPPASTTGAAAAAVRFHTHTSCPALSRFFAMGTPMMPQPRNASFIGSCVFSLSDAVAARGSGALRRRCARENERWGGSGCVRGTDAASALDMYDARDAT